MHLIQELTKANKIKDLKTPETRRAIGNYQSETGLHTN